MVSQADGEHSAQRMGYADKPDKSIISYFALSTGWTMTFSPTQCMAGPDRSIV